MMRNSVLPTTVAQDAGTRKGANMSLLLRFGLPLLLLISSTSAFGQVHDTYVVPAIANTSGANNTRWLTELSIFNPQRHTLKVTMVYLPTGVSPAVTVDVNVAPNMTAFAENVLGDVFRRSGTGSLLLATFADKNPTVPNAILARSFIVNSRTYNTGLGGTFGQSIAGRWVGLQDIDVDGISAIAPGIINSPSNSSGFRTNIGAVNLGRSSVTLRVTVFDANGNVVPNGNAIPFTVPPEGHLQDRLPVSVDHGSIEFWVDGDAFQNDPQNRAVVFPYASMVDNRSGDPVYIEPVLTAAGKDLYKSENPSGAPVSYGTPIDSQTARRIAAMSIDQGDATASFDGFHWKLTGR